MHKPRQVREVFLELRRALDAQLASRDLLEYASAIVEKFHDESDDKAIAREVAWSPFDCRPVDVALADGGWRIMAYETRRGMPIGEEEQEGKIHPWRLQSLMRLAA